MQLESSPAPGKMDEICGDLEVLRALAEIECSDYDTTVWSLIGIPRNKVITIGRAASTMLKINHMAVSGVHCKIWATQFDDVSVPLIYLKDLSLNGTYVNGKRIKRHEIVLLGHGDVVRIPFGIELGFRALGGNCEKDVARKLKDLNCINESGKYTNILRKVFVCKRNWDSKLCAVKVIKNYSGVVPFEAKILQQLDHPNVIRVYQAQISKNHLYIFEDLICGGDLFSYLSNGSSISPIPEFEALIITYQIMCALQYLHRNNIVHRDLKLDNILLESPEPFSKVLLADFGIAKSTRGRMFTVIGTPEYCAPEVGFEFTKLPEQQKKFINYKRTDELTLKKGYDSKCDIWSLGVMVHIMLSGISPFYEDGEEANIIRSAKRGALKLQMKEWQNVSQEAKSFVQSLLHVDTKKRFDIQQCFKHEWIRKHEVVLKDIVQKITG